VLYQRNQYKFKCVIISQISLIIYTYSFFLALSWLYWNLSL